MGLRDLRNTLFKLGRDTKNGIQNMSDSVSISNKISAEKKSLKILLATIGEAVYKENPDTPKAGLEAEWAAVTVAYTNLDMYAQQMGQVKNVIFCPNCGKAAAAGDKFCAKCGQQLTRETTGQRMAQDIKDVGHQVGRIAGTAASSTGEFVGETAAKTAEKTKGCFARIKDKLTGKSGKVQKEELQEARNDAQSAEEQAAVQNEVQQDAARVFTEAAQEAPQEMHQTVTDAVQEVQQTVIEATQETQQTVTEVTQETQQTVTEVTQEVQQTVTEVTQEVQQDTVQMPQAETVVEEVETVVQEKPAQDGPVQE